MKYIYGIEAAGSLNCADRGLEVEVVPDYWVKSREIIRVEHSAIPGTVGFPAGTYYVYVLASAHMRVRRPEVVTARMALTEKGFDAEWILAVLADAGFEIRKATD